jgi:glycine/serine hydroxymethyltransferase
MGIVEMELIGNYISEAIFNRENTVKLSGLRKKVTELTSRFSFPGYEEFEK